MAGEWEVEREEPAKADSWEVVDETPAGRRDLPQGVQASSAGGGRGGQGGPTAQELADEQKRRQLAQRNGATADYARVQGAGAQPLTSTAETGPSGIVYQGNHGGGGSVFDRLTPEQQQAVNDQPLSVAQQVELSRSPAALEAVLKARAYQNERDNAPTIQNAPERGPVQQVLDATLRKPEDGSLAGAALETAGDAARGAIRASQGFGGSMWSGIQAGLENTGLGDTALAGVAGEAGRAARAARTQFGNPQDEDSLTQQVFESTFTNIPVIAAFGAGNPALLAMGAQAAANDYGESRDRGVDPDDALQRAAYMGVAEVLGERFELPALASMYAKAAQKVGVKELAHELEHLLVKEQIGEQVTTALQDAYEKYGASGQKPDMTLGDYLKDVATTAKVTLGQGLLMGGGAGVVHQGADSIRAHQFADALRQDAEDRVLSPANDAALAALSPNPDAIDPRDTARSVGPVAPKVETMPTEVFTPEQLQQMGEATQQGRADHVRDLVQSGEHDLPSLQAAGVVDEYNQHAAAGRYGPDAQPIVVPPIGVEQVPQGSIAARAEQSLKDNAQEAADGRVADVPEPAPRGGGDEWRVVGERSVADAGPAADAVAGGDRSAGAPAPAGHEAGAVRAELAQPAVAESAQDLTPRVATTPTIAEHGPTETAAATGTPAAGLRLAEAGDAAGGGSEGSDRRAARAGILQQRLADYTSEANDAELRARQLQRTGQPNDLIAAEALRAQAEQKRAIAENVQQAQDHPDLPAFERVADTVERKFGHDVVPYVDHSEHAVDGFTDGKTVYVNLANPERSVAFTAFHETQHIIRQRAARGDAAAQRATRLLDQVWAMIDTGAKEQYARRYLFRQHIDAGQMTLQQAMEHPLLKDEMLSDFMGKRAEDESFWRTLAQKNPESFGDFVRHWLGVLKGLVQSLRGTADDNARANLKDIDKAVYNLDRAKLVAEKVLREWVAANPRTNPNAGHTAEPQAPDYPADRRKRPDEVVSLRKQESVLRSLLECLQ
jgi:hypothetical protein